MSNTDAERPPKSFLIPIQGLRVPSAWQVGNVVIHPGGDAEGLVADAPPADSKDDFIRERVLEILRAADDSSVAEVIGVEDIDDGIDLVRSSLDALRLFHLSRRLVQTSSFGLPGDVYQSRIEYVANWERSAPGGRFRGDSIGWAFNADDVAYWSNTPAFGFLHDALADPEASEGARRAVVGTSLFSRAATEHRRDLKMLGLAATLESWVLRRQPGAQTMRLAQHVSWFGCGRHENDLCGRDRPICPYLHLSPDRGNDRRRLSTLRDLGNEHTTWRCSEWHQVMDWYDSRSGAAHGDPTAVVGDDADRAEFWIAHYLAEPILDWLRTHREDPVGDLESELARVSDPSGWGAMLAALDAEQPPEAPPPWAEDSSPGPTA